MTRSMGPLGVRDPRSQGSAGRIAARLFDSEKVVLADRYEIRARLGSGGMGIVDEAYDRRLCRPVAIKRLHTEAVGLEDLSLLAREARALATLAHPNVVPVFDIVAHEGAVAMVMELVEGTSMSTWLSTPPSVRRRLHALRQAAAGLQAAHDRQIVHGDFKPSNVLIDRRGHVRLCDFGLAASLEITRSKLGHAGAPGHWGTPRYMSPEQHAGTDLTAASDQYAFCVTAWLLLTGRLPFADPEALAARKRQGAPPYPTAADVPIRIVRALRRGLEPDPDARWPSMMALRGELQLRGRRTWALLAAAAGIVGTVAATSLVPAGPSEPSLASTEQAVPPARSPRLDVALAMVRDGEKSRARALFGEIFEEAGARGALADVAESAAWLALLTPSSDRATIAKAARDATVVAANIDDAPRVRILTELANARALEEQEPPEVVAQRFADAGSRSDDPLLAHFGARNAAMMLFRTGRFDEALAHLDRAAAHAAEVGSPSLAIETRIDRSQLLGGAGRSSEARATLLALLDEVDSPEPRAHILALLAEHEMSAADLESAAEHFEAAQAILDAEPDADTTLTLRCLILQSDLAVIQLDFDRALASLERARVIAETTRGGQSRASMVIHTKTANLLKDTGALQEALPYLEAALELAEATGNAFEAAHIQVEMANVLADLGHLARAQRLIAGASPVLLGSDDQKGRFVYETVLATIKEKRGDRAGALEHYRLARRWFELGQGPRHAVAGMLLGEEARLAGLLGERVDDHFQDAIDIQRRGGSIPMIYAYTQLAFGRYLWRRGERARARALFEEALPHARQHPGPPPEYQAMLTWLDARGIELDA